MNNIPSFLEYFKNAGAAHVNRKRGTVTWVAKNVNGWYRPFWISVFQYDAKKIRITSIYEFCAPKTFWSIDTKMDQFRFKLTVPTNALTIDLAALVDRYLQGRTYGGQFDPVEWQMCHIFDCSQGAGRYLMHEDSMGV